jgi:hypothetical protein
MRKKESKEIVFVRVRESEESTGGGRAVSGRSGDKREERRKVRRGCVRSRSAHAQTVCELVS